MKDNRIAQQPSQPSKPAQKTLDEILDLSAAELDAIPIATLTALLAPYIPAARQPSLPPERAAKSSPVERAMRDLAIRLAPEIAAARAARQHKL